MAKEQLIIELIAESKNAINNLKNYTKQAKQTSNQVGKLTKVFKSYFAEIGAGILIARKLIRIVKDLVGAYNIQEQAEAKLAAVLKSTGRDVIPNLIDSYTKYASKMQDLTGFSDAAIIDTQALMGTFIQISEDVMPAAMDALLNVSAVMGQDLRSTAIQLGKALNDPILGLTALRRIGIQLSAQQEQSVKSFVAVNDIASAQGIILGELQVQFGGAAKAMGETMAGQMKILSQQFGDLKELVGFFISDSLQPMIPIIRNIVAVSAEWLQSKKDLKEAYVLIKKPMEITNLNMSMELELAKQLTTAHELNMRTKELDIMVNSRHSNATGKMIQALRDEIDVLYTRLAATNSAIPLIKQAIILKENEAVVIDETIERIEKEIEVVITSSDAWSRWAETMRGATDEAIGFNKASETTAEIIENMGSPLDAHRQRFRDIEMQIDATTGAQEKLLDSSALYNDTLTAMAGELKQGQNALKEMAKVGFASVLKALGQMLIAQSFAMWPTPVRAALTLVAGFAAIGAANAIMAMQQGGQVEALQTGGGFGDKQPAMLERGEVVINKFDAQQNAAQIGQMRSGEGGGMQTTIFQIDGETFGKWVYRASTNRKVTISAKAIV